MPSIIPILCIDQIEEFIEEVKEEHKEKPAIGHFQVLLLISVDNIINLAYSGLRVQKL